MGILGTAELAVVADCAPRARKQEPHGADSPY